jgi:hypothetical protein
VTAKGKRRSAKNAARNWRRQFAAIKRMFRQALDAEPKSTG